MKFFLLSLLLFVPIVFFAQNAANDTTDAAFYYPNGQKSSEGKLVNNKPDGYWKTYYETGIVKSEGNRKNFQLDSTWKFYDESGKLTLEINYQQAKKQGNRITYQQDETVYENFENDIKTGFTTHYDKKERLLKRIPFTKGLEEGMAFHYDTLGTITEIINYKRGYIIDRERINRRDSENNPHGVWKWFYENGVVKQEGIYKNGLKNGIFKSFDTKGNLTKIEKFVDDIRQESAEEVARLELKRDYFPNGKVKVEATYRQGIPEGIRREFNEQGEVVQSFTFVKGVMVAQGIVSNEGLKQGFWKEYFPNGKIKSEGAYEKGKRIGQWTFYYPQGAIEQTGNYNSKGNPEGIWKWFYLGGQLLREESYRDGLLDGIMTEYSSEGLILAQGEYIEDKEEGFWIIQNGFQREEGNFVEGYLTGQWKYYYENDVIAFEGNFVDDNPNGKHTFYYPEGTKREEGNYLIGRRNGVWKKWNEDGSLLIEIEYINGVEKAYDGLNIPDDEIIIAE